jgi:hypothetical protein
MQRAATEDVGLSERDYYYDAGPAFTYIGKDGTHGECEG